MREGLAVTCGNCRHGSLPMAPHHIRKYQEIDHKRVLELFSQGMIEHVPATFRHMLKLPQTFLLLLGVPITLLLVSGSWLLALVSNVTLLVFLWLLARQPWRKYVVVCFQTDLADITKSYLRARGSCFWVAESGGQVAGIVGALPVEDAPPGRKQLQLFHLSVALEHRGEGLGKALVMTVLQFARAQGYSEVVLDTSIVQQAALTLYLRMGFQKTGEYFYNKVFRLVYLSTIRLTYFLPSAQEGGP
ncbi:putative N-acetyltransferase CML1, transcript variant X1 [Ictidomys tridecemlineatus]|uniref:probable N-acetyltransferase CML1 n=1 Tax=Ictidomys tridecemlineatus TaxID=43179 RepID=UPI000B542303|nr:probable N-acetyltransferase CML1 [Ictidomys tridecemlineatus]XP_021580033.1 probable N-acetyltransferase CML1 [Ictidomys tridecemlineatus]KAG3267076.1 putative N-acetyltransferase CML1, transcript variant X2 [Ictidomys tridecemlineatus]KAG3267077.1 putative N-acetyltransferase CML1, transcript variant X1 [Ictidomys tridecemlineatus]